MAKLSAISQGSITKPNVQGNFKLLNAQTLNFDSTSFTKDFVDPMKGPPGLVTLKSLPFVTLYNLGDPLTVGGTFQAITAQNINIALDDSYAIHNGVLYQFTKSIDAIIADYDALGKKLLFNTNGLLVFINPNNITDTVVVQGDGVTGKELEFTFTVKSSVSNKESNVATFSIVPWENVNIKPNYILTLPSNGADNPIVGFTVVTSTVAEVTTRTATIRLQDNTELVQSWTVETATPLSVTDNNANSLRHLIATVGAKQLFETLTSLAQPTILGTVVSWPYVNENGATQTVSLDLEPLLPNVVDINIDTVEWTVDNDNILHVIETDLTVHEVDFTPFEITTAVNANGQLEVSQKGEIKFSISKVGISNDYNDLDNRPNISGQLPPGRKDQLYFINEEGTNNVIPDWLMSKGIIVQTQKEFVVASTSAISLEQVFSTWRMFSHHNGKHAASIYVSPPYFPALNIDINIPSQKLTADEFYNRTAWGYDPVNDRIFLSKNYDPYTGFISPREFSNYTFEATFSSPNLDDDWMALVIGFWVDPFTAYEHTLSVVRTMATLSGQAQYNYALVKNFSQMTEEVIIDATPLAPIASGSTGGWRDNGPTRVSIVRTFNNFVIKTSQFGSAVLDDTTILNVNLDDYPQLEGFKIASKVAFAAKSQQDAYFSDIIFTGLIDYIFFDQGNYYETFEYDYNTEEYFLQDPKEMTTAEYFGKNRFVESYMFNKIYFINDEDDIICVKGDGVVSWDPFNAITEGSDKRAFLNSALLGGTTAKDKIKYFNPNYQQNLDFLWKAQWVFAGTLFTLNNDPQTSDAADITFSRIDVFALNSDGTGTIIKGIPSADPVKPSIDPLTQLEAGFIIIDANATTPNGVTSDQVYNENLQVAGGEFNTSVYPVATTRLILNSTSNPYIGNKAIEGTNLQLYDAVEFTPAAPIAINQLSSLGYSIKIKSGSYNKHKGPSHRVQLQGTDAGENPVTIYLPEDTSANIFEWTTYQNLSLLIPQDSAIVNVSKIRLLSWVASNLNFGFYLDNIFLVKGTQSYQLESYATIKYVDDGLALKQGLIPYTPANDAEVVKSVNNNLPDVNGNVVVVAGGGGSGITGRYDTYAAMVAAKGSQVDKGIYTVADASGFSTVDTVGTWADFEYLGTVLGTESDYRKLSEQESMDVAVGGGGASPLTAYTIYVNKTTGNNGTALIEDKSKPFATIDAAMAAMPNDGNIWTIFLITSEAYPINGTIPKFKKIRITSNGSPTVTFASNPTIGYLNEGWDVPDGYFFYLDFDLPNGTILFTAPGDGSANSVKLEGALGFIGIKADRVDVSNSFIVARNGGFIMDIKTLNQTGAFISTPYSGGGAVYAAGNYIKIGTLNGSGNIIFPSAYNSGFTWSVGSMTTDGIFGFGDAPSGTIYSIKAITCSQTVKTTLSGSMIYQFNKAILNGKISLSGNIYVRGSFETLNNNELALIWYGGVKTFENCVIKSVMASGSGLFQGYKTQDITFINCVIEIVSGYLSQVNGVNWNYTGIGAVAKFKGINSIIHHTDNGLMQNLSAAQTGGISWQVDGIVKTNGLMQDSAGNITVTNRTQNTY